jgi:protein gp37
MAANSKIEWTHHTFNPWRGCTRVSEGCRNCYAETLSHRNPAVLGEWGPQGRRTIAAESAWSEPVRWNRWAREGVCYACKGSKRIAIIDGSASPCRVCGGESNIGPYRARVFCASLADVFEGVDTMPAKSVDAVEIARRRLFKLIDNTPSLDWLLLTKRPENILRLTPGRSRCASWPNCNHPDCVADHTYENVWLGTSIEDRKSLGRVDVLRSVPSRIRFLSVEPLLEDLGTIDLTGIHWVIVGCESNGKKVGRLPDYNNGAYWEAADSIRKQCEAAQVAFFHKQGPNGNLVSHDPDDWPTELRIREFPCSQTH